jgi:hypothetical protein
MIKKSTTRMPMSTKPKMISKMPALTTLLHMRGMPPIE